MEGLGNPVGTQICIQAIEIYIRYIGQTLAYKLFQKILWYVITYCFWFYASLADKNVLCEQKPSNSFNDKDDFLLLDGIPAIEITEAEPFEAENIPMICHKCNHLTKILTQTIDLKNQIGEPGKCEPNCFPYQNRQIKFFKYSGYVCQFTQRSYDGFRAQIDYRLCEPKPSSNRTHQ